MHITHGNIEGSFLVAHGGAGSQDPQAERVQSATDALVNIVQKVVTSKASGEDILLGCIMGMEKDPLFNAGYGAALQADGAARLTAAMMDGKRQSFSAVQLASNTIHPSLIAKYLQTKSSRVLSGIGAEIAAREIKLDVQSPLTVERSARWQKWIAEGNSEKGYDTVGCVVRDAKQSRLWAATSTGGRAFEYPGRVSDSGTVAGNYATAIAAISCTGIGEEIMDDGLSVRVETRCRDGMSLYKACQLALEEAKALNREYGWIALHKNGDWCVCHTTPKITYVVMDFNRSVLSKSK